MSRIRARSRDRFNQFEGQGVEAFVPLPSLTSNERIQQQKQGCLFRFNRSADRDHHIIDKAPEPAQLYQPPPRSPRKQPTELQKKTRRQAENHQRAVSREPEVEGIRGARGRTPQPPASHMLPTNARKRTNERNSSVEPSYKSRSVRSRSRDRDPTRPESPPVTLRRSGRGVSREPPSVSREPPIRRSNRSRSREPEPDYSEPARRSRGRPPVQQSTSTPRRGRSREPDRPQLIDQNTGRAVSREPETPRGRRGRSSERPQLIAQNTSRAVSREPETSRSRGRSRSIDPTMPSPPSRRRSAVNVNGNGTTSNSISCGLAMSSEGIVMHVDIALMVKTVYIDNNHGFIPNFLTTELMNQHSHGLPACETLMQEVFTDYRDRIRH
uniref:Uncharacterized protein n=1 Tax=Panagrolaimus sp. JU765 TaxID=591449 RepID=A0AC34RBF7_9BILA